MPFLARVISPALIFDHQAKPYDVAVDLVLLDQDCAFVKKDDQIIGIVCLDNLHEEFISAVASEDKVAEFIEPLFSINEYKHSSIAMELMLMKNIEHIGVTNGGGDFVGIASLKEIEE